MWRVISSISGRMEGWLTVIPGQQLTFGYWFLIRNGQQSKLKENFYNCKILKLKMFHYIKKYIKWLWYLKKKYRSFTSFIRRVGATISLWRPITVFGSTLKIAIAVVIVIAVSLVDVAPLQFITAELCPWVVIITWKRLCATPGIVRKVSIATICFTDQVK